MRRHPQGHTAHKQTLILLTITPTSQIEDINVLALGLIYCARSWIEKHKTPGILAITVLINAIAGDFRIPGMDTGVIVITIAIANGGTITVIARIMLRSRSDPFITPIATHLMEKSTWVSSMPARNLSK